MLPIGDDDSARRTSPVVTYALIAFNVLFFLVELSAGDAFIERWSVVPRRLLANPTGDFLTIFTAMFMHAFAQVLVDPRSNIPNLGASGAIAGVLGAYLLMFPRGSVRVLMGRGIIPLPAIVVIGFWAVLQFLSGFGAIATTEQTGGGGVAYMAHVGGFIAGLVLAVIMGGTRQEPRLRAY